MANIDINSSENNTTKSYEEAVGYCNVYLPEELEDGTVEWTQLGKYGVNLLESRELDMALLDLADSDPDSIQELTVKITVNRAKSKKRDGKPKLKLGSIKK